MCEFTFDPEVWPNEVHMFDEVWSCPYPSLPNHNYCIFHILPQVRELEFTTQRKRTREYIKAIKSVGLVHIICTTVRKLNIDLLSKFTYRNDQIQIGYTTVFDGLYLSENQLDGYLAIEDCRITTVNFESSRFSSGIRIQRSGIENLKLSEAAIEGQASFIDCVFKDSSFIKTRFNNTVSFCERVPDDTPISGVDDYLGKNSCTFLETPSFMGTKFDSTAFFANVDFKSGGNFNDAQFNKGAVFSDASFDIGCHFGSAIFYDKTAFDNAELSKANFEKTEFRSAVTFNGANFGSKREYMKSINLTHHCSSEGIDQTKLENYSNILDDFVFDEGIIAVSEKAASLDNIVAQDKLDLNDVTAKNLITAFSSNIYFLELDIEFDCPSPTITFYGSNIERGIIRVPDENSFLELTNTTIGDISLVSEIDRNPLKNIYIENTIFDGFNFSNYRTELREINWLIDGYFHEGEHRESDHPEGTYAKAKAGAQNVGDYYAESKFFIREQKARREEYWNKISQNQSKLESVENIFYYSSNLLYDVLCEYAESSKRVVGWSLLIVVLFAEIYHVLGVDLPYTSIGFLPNVSSLPNIVEFLDSKVFDIGHVIFSLESFSAFLVGGGPQIIDPVVRIFTSIQAFVGTFLIALFVATLIRSVKR